jgi:hypothetical protein
MIQNVCGANNVGAANIGRCKVQLPTFLSGATYG